MTLAVNLNAPMSAESGRLAHAAAQRAQALAHTATPKERPLTAAPAVHAGLAGVSDPRQLMHSIQNDLVLLTRNHDDFEDLHLLLQAAGGQHPGLLVVRSDNDPSRDMKDRDITRALANLAGAGVSIANEFHILNHWR